MFCLRFPDSTPIMSTTITVVPTNGFFVFDMFSDKNCVNLLQRSTYSINRCYNVPSTGMYLYGNLTISQQNGGGFPTFSFQRSSTTSAASCTSATSFSAATTLTSQPSSSSSMGNCTSIRVGSSSGTGSGWYSISSWQPLAQIPTSIMGSSYTNGAIFSEFGSSIDCTTTNLAVQQYVRTGFCVPLLSIGNNVIYTDSGTKFFKVLGCGSSLTIASYSDKACTVSSSNVFPTSYNSLQTCITNPGFPAVTIYDPFYATVQCVNYAYASGGYRSVQIYADTGTCAVNDLLFIQEFPLNTCYYAQAQSGFSGYIATVTQVNILDKTVMGSNSYQFPASPLAPAPNIQQCQNATSVLTATANVVTYTSR